MPTLCPPMLAVNPPQYWKPTAPAWLVAGTTANMLSAATIAAALLRYFFTSLLLVRHAVGLMPATRRGNVEASTRPCKRLGARTLLWQIARAGARAGFD